MKQKIRNMLLQLWLKVPECLRLKVYRLLERIGKAIWGPATQFGGIQRLPFGFYMKGGPAHPEWTMTLTNEYFAVKLVKKHTEIPVPEVIDLVFTEDRACLITTRVPGEPLGKQVVRILENDDTKAREKLIRDLRYLVIQLRSIPNRFGDSFKESTGMHLCNTYGGPLLDVRFNNHMAGPFATEAEFNEELKVSTAPHLKHKDNHWICFTHGDLNMRNILVQDGEISGVVDWEFAGWYPEYWEYTKCDYAEYGKRWFEIVDEVFAGLTGQNPPFAEEKKVEIGLRGYVNPF
jgi:aminoglycoside phosphotransferase